MKILLAAVNAKYIHSNLAVYSLKAYAEDPAVEIGEYTINQQKDDILMDIYKRQPDILCLSCYIWNLDYIEEIVLEIGKLRPDMPIWLGGPEVSYDASIKTASMCQRSDERRRRENFQRNLPDIPK